MRNNTSHQLSGSTGNLRLRLIILPLPVVSGIHITAAPIQSK